MKERPFMPSPPTWTLEDGGLTKEQILAGTAEEHRKRVEEASVVVVPITVQREGLETSRNFTRDALIFAKAVGDTEPRFAVAWDERRGSIHYHADEIWLQGLYVAGTLGLNVLGGLIATFLYERFGKKPEKAPVHLEISVEDADGRVRRIKYDGPADALLADTESGKFVARVYGGG